MSNLHAPFRYDYVGSFLRPAALKEARAKFEAGEIDREALKKVEDEAITDLVGKIKGLGYHVITDGEFRRATWHLDFMWGFDGVTHQKTEQGVCFNGEQALIDDTWICGKVGVSKEHPFIEHYRFVKQFEDENTVAKMTIPAAAQFLQQMLIPKNEENTHKFYPDEEELVQDIVKGYHVVLQQLYDAGCRTVQLDDCTWGACVDCNVKRLKYETQEEFQAIMERYLRINNLVIEGAPEGMVVNTHICRGNYHSTFFSQGPYDVVADYVFARENVNAYYLEFDDERSGGFEPLAKIGDVKKVVLGLITTKSPKLEDKEYIINRIHEAAKYIPLERLHLSPQCGFASCEIGNKLTEEEQWAKLRLVKEIAEEVWGK